jgi:PTH1 family peptidyl-tRNA hydrolase
VFWRRRATAATKLICGLGNPGPEYQGHRHNIGYRVLDALADRFEVKLTQRKFEGRIGLVAIGNDRVLMLKPETFMNASGEAVAAAARFYRIQPARLLVIHDELDLPYGRLQLKAGGGAGGHNGLKSIIERIGWDEFVRLRFGISKPQGPRANERVIAHVLSDFTREEQRTLPELVGQAADAAEAWTRDGLANAMNRFNRRKPASVLE